LYHNQAPVQKDRRLIIFYTGITYIFFLKKAGMSNSLMSATSSSSTRIGFSVFNFSATGLEETALLRKADSAWGKNP
jgi:hypothetical protein